jgi:hypothetical protein
MSNGKSATCLVASQWLCVVNNVMASYSIRLSLATIQNALSQVNIFTPSHITGELSLKLKEPRHAYFPTGVFRYPMINTSSLSTQHSTFISHSCSDTLLLYILLWIYISTRAWVFYFCTQSIIVSSLSFSLTVAPHLHSSLSPILPQDGELNHPERRQV